MYTARFKPARASVMLRNHRILCGKAGADGVQRCRGELGHLIVEIPEGTAPYLSLHPLVNATMAANTQGHYRLSRQRRPFRSGTQGRRHVGGGMGRAISRYRVQDQDGVARKWLPAIRDVDGQDGLVIVCPRCESANAVTYAAFTAYLERVFAPR